MFPGSVSISRCGGGENIASAHVLGIIPSVRVNSGHNTVPIRLVWRITRFNAVQGSLVCNSQGVADGTQGDALGTLYCGCPFGATRTARHQDGASMTLEPNHLGVTTVSRGSDREPPASHVSVTAVEDRAYARGWRTFVPSEPRTHVRGHVFRARRALPRGINKHQRGDSRARRPAVNSSAG